MCGLTSEISSKAINQCENVSVSNGVAVAWRQWRNINGGMAAMAVKPACTMASSKAYGEPAK